MDPCRILKISTQMGMRVRSKTKIHRYSLKKRKEATETQTFYIKIVRSVIVGIVYCGGR